MTELIEFLEVSKYRNGADFPLTIGHLLNICRKAESLKNDRLERAAILEDKQHNEIMNWINSYGQD